LPPDEARDDDDDALEPCVDVDVDEVAAVPLAAGAELPAA
jgi:hypothetical protein